MAVYVVKPGDSLYSIAAAYGVTPERIAADNMIADPSKLVNGQSLYIAQGQRVYTVRPGDTVYSLARRFGVTQQQILAANPQIGANAVIRQGDRLIIPAPQQRLGTIEVNGYIFPGSKVDVVTAALPSLTYLSIFSYEARADGSLNSINDEEWITLARKNHVAPMMVVTNIREGGHFNSDLTRQIFADPQVQKNLINNILTTLQQKNYYAVNIDFEYIFPSDRQNYNRFITELTAALHPQGYQVFVALAPKLSATQAGVLYEAHDYAFQGRAADRVILMTYEWGYLAGPPQAVAPLDQVRKVLNYAVTVIPREKILLGVPNYGYDWTLPYVKGTLATTFSNIEAVNRAQRNHAEIQYDSAAQSPYYTYYDADKKQHIAWFEDARSVTAKYLLVNEYGLAGVSFWTAERPFPQNYLILNTMFTVKKVV
ncbi:MAG: LysM peptidoglycan-binding domain-containing protein [Clostridia bacterium]|nr:LysM peptidoglycan-binding domain-containing protein [Clostridia bacterium]